MPLLADVTGIFHFGSWWRSTEVNVRDMAAADDVIRRRDRQALKTLR